MEWSPMKREISARKMFDVSWQDLLDSQPFYGAKMFSLEVIETTSIPTMATDGKRLLYNPEFTLSLGRKQCTFVELHEMLHVVFLHHVLSAEMKKELGDNYDHQQFNVAADYEINQIIVRLIKEGGISLYEMPDDLLFDERFDGMLLREIYFILEGEKKTPPPFDTPTNPGPTGQGGNDENGDDNGTDTDSGSDDNNSDTSDDNGNGGGGGNRSDNTPESGTDSNDASGPDSGRGCGGNDTVIPTHHGEVLTPENEDGTELSKEQIKELRSESEREQMAAAKFAEKQGKGDMVSLNDVMDRITLSAPDWNGVLEEFFTDSVQHDVTLKRPNKRFYPHGIIMPTASKKRIGKVAILGDESASVNNRLAALWFDAMNDILSRFESIEVVYIPFTHRAGESVFYTESDLPINPARTMSGGTDFKAPFSALFDEDFEPDVILVLTDMLCSSFPIDPGVPTFWCEACDGYYRNRARKPPFGELLRIRE